MVFSFFFGKLGDLHPPTIFFSFTPAKTVAGESYLTRYALSHVNPGYLAHYVSAIYLFRSRIENS